MPNYSLDPIETVTPPVTPEGHQRENDYLAQFNRTDVSQPGAVTPEGLALEKQRFAVEGDLISPLTPSGQDPNINWGKAPQQPSSVWDTGAQLGTGVLSGLAGIAHTLAPTEDYRRSAAAIERGASESSDEMGGLPGAFTVGSGVAGSIPYFLTGAAGGLPAIVAYAGITGASDGYRDAVDAGYAHPEAVGLAKGLISGLVMALPGARGIGGLAKAKELVGDAAFDKLLQMGAKEIGGNAVNNTVTGAAQMGVQSLLDSLTDKLTTNPNLTLADALHQATNAAGTGGVIAGLVGAAHEAASVHDARAQAHQMMVQDFDRSVQNTPLGNTLPFNPPLRTGEYPVSPEPGLKATGSLRPPAPVERAPEAPAAKEPVEAPKPTPVVEPVAPAQSEPARTLTPEQTTTLQAHFDQAGMGRGIELTKAEFTDPYNAHLQNDLRVALGKRFPVSWADLAEQGAVKIKPLAGGKTLVSYAGESTAPVPAEIGNFFGASQETINELNQYRVSNGMVPLRQGTPEELAALTVGERAVSVGRNREYTPAVQAASGNIYTGSGHTEAMQAAYSAKENMAKVRRGYVTPEGKFLSLMDVARLEMAKQATEAPKPAEPSPKETEYQGGEMPRYTEHAPVAEPKPAATPTPEQDVARYTDLQKQIRATPFDDPKFHDLWVENEMIKNRHGGMPPVEPAKPAPAPVEATPASAEPVAPAPKAKAKKQVATPEPIASIEGRLPEKGERVQMGDFFVTKDRTGKTVLRATGELEPRALATLKTKNTDALSQRAVMADLLANERGQPTKYWDFPKRESKITAAAGKATKEEKSQQSMDEVNSAFSKKDDVDTAIRSSIESGGLSPEVIQHLVGAAVLPKGPKAIVTKLREALKQATELYLNGELEQWVPHEKDEAGKHYKAVMPDELQGEHYRGAELLDKVYKGDKKALTARVLDLLVNNTQTALSRGEVEAKERMGLTGEKTTESSTGDPTEALQAKAAQGGTDFKGEFVSPTGEVKYDTFTDEILKGKDGKIDPKRVALAERADEIKQELIAGNEGNYDEAVGLLRQLGLSQIAAERWMDAEDSFLSPKKPGAPTTFITPPHLLDPNINTGLQFIVDRGTPEQRVLAKKLLDAGLTTTIGAVSNRGLGFDGKYYADRNHIDIGASPTQDPVLVFLHEAVHAFTVKALRAPSTPGELAFRAEIERLYKAAVAEVPATGETAHALSRPEEFVASLTDPAFQGYLRQIIDPKSRESIWSQVVSAVKRLLGIAPKSIADSAVDALMKLKTNAGPATVDSFRLPEIKNKNEYERAIGFQELPQEETEILNRKALANNNWVLAPDVQSIYDSLPDKVKSVLRPTIGKRLDVLGRVIGQPGSEHPSTLQHILADPAIEPERKSEISLSTLYNFLHFRQQAGSVQARSLEALNKLVSDLPKLDKQIDESTIAAHVMQIALDELVDGFKGRVLAERQQATDDTRIEYLTRLTKLADEFKGDRRTALSKFLSKVADEVPLEVLTSVTDPKQLNNLINQLLPANGETAQEVGASEETIRLASIVLANSNVLREELLSLKLIRDPKVRAAVLGIDAENTARWTEGDLPKELSKFVIQSAELTNSKQAAQALYQKAFKAKLRRVESASSLVKADDALQRIQQTPSYKDTFQLLVDKNQATKPMVVRTADNLLSFIDPLTQNPVDISIDFTKQGEAQNYKKLADLVDSAKAYLADPTAKGYDPLVAAFWKNIVRNSDSLLDPTISMNARKLIPAKYDLLQMIKLGGALTIVPDAVLREVGGRAANDAQVGFQAYSAVDSQLKTLKEVMDASLSLTAKKAADAHNLDIPTWHTEVLNPLLASMQHTGYAPLKAGDQTLWGHVIKAPDLTAARTQADFDRRARAIGYEAKGNPAVERNPASVVFKSPAGETVTRRAQPTGSLTMSRRLNDEAGNWATLWAADQDVNKRIQFLNDNFVPVVLGHVTNAGADNYAVTSKQADLYKAVARDVRKGAVIGDVNELVDRLFDKQAENREPGAQVTKMDILEGLFEDMDTIFDNVTGFRKSKEQYGTGPVLNVVTSDNSFTQERGKLIAPTTFYEHGLTFDGQRIALMHSAKAHYAMELIGDGGLLDRLVTSIKSQITKYEAQIAAEVKKTGKPANKVAKALETEQQKSQLNGDLLLTYQQARQAEKQVGRLLDELRRGVASTTTVSDPSAIQLAQTAQGFLASNLMMSPMAESSNLFGGYANLVAFDKMLGGSVMRSIPAYGLKLVRDGVKDLLAATPKPLKGAVIGAGVGLGVGGLPGAGVGALAGAAMSGVHAAARSGALGEMGEAIYNLVKSRELLHREMEGLGMAGASNLSGDMQANLQLFSEGGRPQQNGEGLAQRLIHRGEAAANLISKPLSSVFPRVVDRLINIQAIEAANTLEKVLLTRAMKSGDAREAVGAPAFPLSDQEMAGHTGAGAGRDAENIRETFRRIGLNADTLMASAYAKSKSGAGTGSLFENQGHRAAFQYSVAQDINLGAYANRPTSTKGGKLRNLLGLFFGFPIWQATQLSRWSSRLSTDKTTAPYVGKVAALAMTLALMGATATVVKKQLSRNVFNEEPSYQDITEAKNPGEVAAILANGLAQYVPFGGWVINNLLLNSPNKNGFDISSQFAMLNFANDIAKSIQKSVQTHDIYRPAMDLMRRWAPISRVVLNQLPSNEGLVDYYNLTRQLKNIAPEGMETRKRGGGGAMDPTPTTPIMQDMVNAAYRGDTEGFQKASEAYIKYKMDNGETMQQAQKALQSSWQSYHPLMREFGRLPTQAEEIALFNNATPQQQQSILKANQVFETYGGLLGGHTNSVAQRDNQQSGQAVAPIASGGPATKAASNAAFGGSANALIPTKSGSGSLVGSSVFGGSGAAAPIRTSPKSRSGSHVSRGGSGSLRLPHGSKIKGVSLKSSKPTSPRAQGSLRLPKAGPRRLHH